MHGTAATCYAAEHRNPLKHNGLYSRQPSAFHLTPLRRYVRNTRRLETSSTVFCRTRALETRPIQTLIRLTNGHSLSLWLTTRMEQITLQSRQKKKNNLNVSRRKRNDFNWSCNAVRRLLHLTRLYCFNTLYHASCRKYLVCTDIWDLTQSLPLLRILQLSTCASFREFPATLPVFLLLLRNSTSARGTDLNAEHSFFQ
jgi:hypothetical protein